MKRLRALFLLGALLTNPVGIVAAVVFPASDCCCCFGAGGMCPMHRNQKSQKEKAPCHGSDQSQPTCMCAVSQQVQPVISQSAPKATFTTLRVFTLPVTIYEFASFDPGPSFSRFVSPPEQPPRL